MHATKTRRWYTKFQNGQTSLVDLQCAPRGKTGTSQQSVQAVKAVVDGSHSLTVAAIGVQICLPTTCVHWILTKELQLSLRGAILLPDVLMPHHIVECFTHCRNMLNKTRATPSFLKKIVTMDEFWIYQYDPELKRQASQWLTKDQPQPTHPHHTLSTKKCMLVAFFKQRGMIHMEFVRGDC